MEPIVLASSSARRKELLAALSLPFRSIDPDIDESVYDHLEPLERVIALAEAKARQGYSMLSADNSEHPRFILAADTLVAFKLPGGWHTIGKPQSREDARKMLLMESGKTQTVYTGLHFLNTITGTSHSAWSETQVTFCVMSEDEIDFYLDTDEWRGAAGAYRVQGIGSLFISSIIGSWSGVVGLPIHELYGILKAANYDFSNRSR
jgi:septum formation protein